MVFNNTHSAKRSSSLSLFYCLVFFLIIVVVGVVVVESKVHHNIINKNGGGGGSNKFDGDFEFADEDDVEQQQGPKSLRNKGGLSPHHFSRKTWILDPGSDLCQALNCKKKELCLLEDEFTAVCVSKKELHKNGDIILPKSKLRDTPPSPNKDHHHHHQSPQQNQYQTFTFTQTTTTTTSTTPSTPPPPSTPTTTPPPPPSNSNLDPEEDTENSSDSDYYEDDEDEDDEDDDDDEGEEDEDEDLEDSEDSLDNDGKIIKKKLNKSEYQNTLKDNRVDKDFLITGNQQAGSGGSENGLKCAPCPIMKPSFVCGSDNRTYSSLCRLDYHNCIQGAQILVSCKGFCPCKNNNKVDNKPTGSSSQGINNNPSKRAKNTRPHHPIQNPESNDNNNNYNNIIINTKLSPKNKESSMKKNPTNKRIIQQKDPSSSPFYYKTPPIMDKDKTGEDKRYNEVFDIKTRSKGTLRKDTILPKGQECSKDDLTSMRIRLLDWFSVLIKDENRKMKNKNNSNNKNKNNSKKVRFPSSCKPEVKWMFGFLKGKREPDDESEQGEEGSLSFQDFYELEYDRNEKCIIPYLHGCDVDKDSSITPYEWCRCFIQKQQRGNEYDDEDSDDDDIYGSGEGALEI